MWRLRCTLIRLQRVQWALTPPPADRPADADLARLLAHSQSPAPHSRMRSMLSPTLDIQRNQCI